MAADLVRRQVAVIATSGGAQSALAAKAATSTIPIVFTVGSDPVRAGLVPSLNRPGGNVTGVSFLTDALATKRLGLLREIMRAPTTIAVLINPQGPDAANQLKDVRSASQAIGQPIHIVLASTQAEIDAAFPEMSQNRATALIVGADPFFNDRRQQIVALAVRSSLPAVYESREFVLAGGLMSYGASIADAYRQGGGYTGRSLKGEKPGEPPVIQAVNLNSYSIQKQRSAGLELNHNCLLRRRGNRLRFECPHGLKRTYLCTAHVRYWGESGHGYCMHLSALTQSDMRRRPPAWIDFYRNAGFCCLSH